MEDNKSLLEYLPKEILYYFARYIDLRDLGALLFTSKQINALLQIDLAFQKIVCDATPMRLIQAPHLRPIRVMYYDAIASIAVKYNDANIMIYSLENLSADHIISKLRPKKDYSWIQTTEQKLDWLNEIMSKDADKVLEFLLEECQKVDTTAKRESNKAPVRMISEQSNSFIEPPPYVPHGVKMKYDGKEVELTPEQEEMASYFARYLETQAKNSMSVKNFFAEWLKVLNPIGSTPHVIQKFELCDFTPIVKHLKGLEKRNTVVNYAAIEKIFNFLMDECICYKNVASPDKCYYPKVIAVVLIRSEQRFTYVFWMQEPKAIRLLQSLLKYSKHFKEHSIDINAPIEVKRTIYKSTIEFEASPLEAAAFYGLKSVFHLLIEHRAVVDLKRPYLPLLCITNASTSKEFFDYLVDLGADLNAFLPESLAVCSTILGYAAELFASDSIIEFLLIKGAKLSAAETSKFLNEDEFKRHVALAQLEEYNPKNRKTQIHFDHRNSVRTFKSLWSSRSELTLMANGDLVYFTHKAKRIGRWKQDPDGRNYLTSNEEMKYRNFGSYGSAEITIDAPLLKHEFIVYRNFKNELAILLLDLNEKVDVHNVFVERR